MGRDLYLILGASGRLGSRVARRIAAEGGTLLLAGRREEALRALADDLPGPVRTVACDVASADTGHLPEAVLQTEADRVVVVDAVVDKASTGAMRVSLDGAARAAGEVCACARRAGLAVRVVSAGSIAAYARWPYSSSYARAKHRQLAAYRALGVPASVVLLPHLYDPGEAPHPAISDRVLWRLYDQQVQACSFGVAACILAALALAGVDHSGTVRVLTQEHSLLSLRGLRRTPGSQTLAWAAAVPVILAGRTVLRARPNWQRRAAYAALLLTPKHLRGAWDHHRPPETGTLLKAPPDLERYGIRLHLTDPGLADVRAVQQQESRTG